MVKLNFSTYLSEDVIKKIHKHTKKTGLPITFIVENALLTYFDKLKENDKK